MQLKMHSVRKNILKVIVFVLLFMAAQPAGEILVKLVGGSNIPAPYTSLSFTEPEKASRIVEGQIVRFVVENNTNSQRKYYWESSINNIVFDQGSLELKDKTLITTKTIPLQSGKLRISLVGSNIEIIGKVVKKKNTVVKDNE